jgi:hypothetical protein
MITLSALFGSSSEALIDNLAPNNLNPASSIFWIVSAARSIALVLVDSVDNTAGELESIRTDLANSHLEYSLETFTGETEFKKVISNFLTPGKSVLDGPGAIFAKRAIKAALGGAASGFVLSFPLAALLSDENMEALEKAAIGGPLGIGFALAIPLTFRSATQQVSYVISDLIKDGKIAIPNKHFQSEKEIRQLIHSFALEELTKRVGYQSSLVSLAQVPFVGALFIASVRMGIPPDVAREMVTGLLPGMENLLKIPNTFRAAKRLQNRIEQLTDYVLKNSNISVADVTRFLNPRPTHAIARALTASTKLPRAALPDTNTTKANIRRLK